MALTDTHGRACAHTGRGTHRHTHTGARVHTRAGGHLHPTLGSSDFTAASTVGTYLLFPPHGAVGSDGGGGKQRPLSSYLRWEARCGPSGARLRCQLSLSGLLRWPRARSGKGWVHFLGSAIPVGRRRKVIHMKVVGFCYHIYCEHPVGSLAVSKQNAKWSLDEG